MITAAQILNIDAQADGRKYVVEVQTDDSAGNLRFVYLAQPSDDPNAIMSARTAAINAALSAVPTVTVTEDDGTTTMLRTYDVSNLSLQLTAAQKSALSTARTVLLTLKPFLRLYQALTPAQQQAVLTHSPWIQQALDVIYGG